MGGALEVGYLYVALTPQSIAWRGAAVSRILREVQSSCMIFFSIVESGLESMELHAPRPTAPLVILVP